MSENNNVIQEAGDVFIFKTQKGPKGICYKVSVKAEFLKKCPNPETLIAQDLNEKHVMFSYIHNLKEPAVTRYKPNSEEVERFEYWIDGLNLETTNKELYEEVKSRHLFTDKLNQIVSE